MQLLFSIIFWLLFGFSTAYVAQQKGRDPAIWFVIGLLLGILGLLLVFILPPVTEEEPSTSESEIQLDPISVQDVSAVSEHLPEGYENFQWFYLTGEKEQIGPLSFEELRDKWLDKTVEDNTFVWCEGMPDWHRMEELKIFNVQQESD